MADNKNTNVNGISRRRVVTGFGALAAAGFLPRQLPAQNSVNEAETLIIGGGIAGASTAMHLAELGRDVMLLERGEHCIRGFGAEYGRPRGKWLGQ